jgi:ribosome modulation factor
VDDRLLTTESARHQGREAFFAGLPRESCPFPQDSGEWRAWTGAWEAARDYRVWLDVHLEREA